MQSPDDFIFPLQKTEAILLRKSPLAGLTETSTGNRIAKFIDRYFWVIVLLILTFAALNKNRGHFVNGVIASDVVGYYSYLPGVFIYGDFTQYPFHDGGHRGVETKLGHKQIKYTYGLALFYLPFFLIAHLFCLLFGWEASGFSLPYYYAVLFCVVFYATLGLWVLKKVLSRYFAPRVYLPVLFCIMLGNNFYYYTIDEMGMSHVYSFFLFAAFIYFTPRFLDDPGWKNTSFLSIIFAIAVLVRPTNGIIVFFLLLFDIRSYEDFKKRVTFFIKRYKKLAFAFFACCLFYTPQVIYWSLLNGELTMYSYGNQSFIYWNNPKILDVWFSVQNGLFIYTPIMLIAIAGVFISIRKKSFQSPVILLIFFMASYAFGSWWAWWFGGAFGHRCYVEYYALLAIPFGVVIQKLYSWKSWWPKIGVTFCLLIFTYYNLRMTYLYSPPWDGPEWTWDRYIGILQKVF
jgi:hypothetical protein